MKEIGGYFGFEKLVSNEFYADLVSLNCARSALLYVLKAKKIKKLYIPYFLCKSVARACENNGVEVEYYHIDSRFMPVFDKRASDGEAVYIVNYYGVLSDDTERLLKQKYNNIIWDNVQAFFRRPLAGIDTIYSCRKFFGVPDGAYLSTDIMLESPLEADRSADRLEHLTGRLEHSASEYYDAYRKNDASFENADIMNMSLFTHNILGAVNYGEVKTRRSENFSVLSDALSGLNGINSASAEGAFCYPFYYSEGMKLKKHLAGLKIYVPTLWPDVFGYPNCPLEIDFAENILPLPCDQRYSADDMKFIAEEIKKCIN